MLLTAATATGSTRSGSVAAQLDGLALIATPGWRYGSARRGSFSPHGCSDTLSPLAPANHLDGRLGRFNRDVAADDPSGLSGEVRTVARPMPQSLPVTTQTLPASRPDSSVGTGGCCGELLCLRNAHPGRWLRNLVEV